MLRLAGAILWWSFVLLSQETYDEEHDRTHRQNVYTGFRQPDSRDAPPEANNKKQDRQTIKTGGAKVISLNGVNDGSD